MATAGHFSIAYLDDYAGTDPTLEAANRGFKYFKHLTHSLGLALATHKCDSCLTGGGGNCEHLCYTWKYSLDFRRRFTTIHELEAINLVVAVSTFIKRVSRPGDEIKVWTDNISSAYALESERTKDATLGACARELWLIAAINDVHISIGHKPGQDIPLADALSRLHTDLNMERTAHAIIARDNLHMINPVLHGYTFVNSLI